MRRGRRAVAGARMLRSFQSLVGGLTLGQMSGDGDVEMARTLLGRF